MGRIKIILVTGFWLMGFYAFANADTVVQMKQEKFISGNYKNFYVDNLSNLFLINVNNQIKKLNQNGDSVAVFNDTRRYGDIYSLDVGNPLKIIAYYKDFASLIVLDRFLNIVNTIDLRRLGILQAKAVAQSYDNNYWVFDELNGTLKKIDNTGIVLLESPDFRMIFSEPYNPSVIIDVAGLLYLYDEKIGWKIFDYYGAYKQQLAYTNWKDIQADGKNLFGHGANNFFLANTIIPGMKEIKTGIDIANSLKLQQRGGKYFVLKTDGLYVYSTVNKN